MTERLPQVGIGVLVRKDGKVLLGKRLGALRGGEYATPGGHLEFGESFEDCARREAKEEAGIEIDNIRTIALANFIVPATPDMKERQYVHIGLAADWKSGEPENREPLRCEGWAWYDSGALPSPMLEMSRIGFEALETGKTYFGTIHL